MVLHKGPARPSAPARSLALPLARPRARPPARAAARPAFWPPAPSRARPPGSSLTRLAPRAPSPQERPPGKCSEEGTPLARPLAPSQLTQQTQRCVSPGGLRSPLPARLTHSLEFHNVPSKPLKNNATDSTLFSAYGGASLIGILNGAGPLTFNEFSRTNANTR